MASLLPNGKQQFSSAAGPMVGGKVYTYDAGTLVPRATYTDAAGTVPNTNPVILDARGEATIFWSGAYKVVLKDALDNTLWTIDNVQDVSSTLSGSTGASNVGFIQAGANAVARNAQAKMRERWSLEDDGAVGDGATDDRAALQNVLNDLSAAGGGVVYGVPGKTYLARKKVGATKLVGSILRSYGLEIPNNVVIDLQGATIKAEAAVDYVLASNPTSGTGTNNNSNLGIINGIVDFNQASAAGTAQSVAFYGVRKLKLDQLEIKNGYNIALDLEACDEYDIGTLVFRSCTGAAFYMGGATASGGAECTKGRVGSITCYDTADHPTQPGLPGNPTLINASYSQFEVLKAFNSDAGHKVTAGHDLEFGLVLFQDGNTQNSGFKLQGASETQLVERVTVGEVISRDCPGPGMFHTWCRDITIGAYLGKSNASLGLDADVVLGGERVHIGRCVSIDAGQQGLLLSHSNGTYFNRSPSAFLDSLEIINPWSVASSGTATGFSVTNGALRVGKLREIDNRATPKMVRYFGTSVQNKEQSLVVDEFYGRGQATNPFFFGTGFRNFWLGRPDMSPLNFAGGTLALSSAAIGTGVTAVASVGVFTADDVGKLLVAQDGRGIAEITGYTSATEVTVANRVAWVNAAVADDAWYLDRANGGAASFTCTGATISTTVTDYGFLNTSNQGTPVIDVTPTNAAARTLGPVTSYSWSNNQATFNHPAAAGGETYSYRIVGWTS